MDRLLRVGDVFRFVDSPLIVGELAFDPVPPHADFRKLHPASAQAIVNAHWTEHGQGGWKRSRADKVDLTAPPQMQKAEWRVTAVSKTGRGEAHGPHDRYPDGHQVEARCAEHDGVLVFFQTGCFMAMQPPANCELIGSSE